MKKLLVLILSIVTSFALCVPAFATESAESVPAGYPVLGSWILTQVYQIKDGERILLTKENAQSVYGSGISIFTFDTEGFAQCRTFDAGEGVDADAKWTSTAPDVYVYSEQNLNLTFTYNKDEDTLHRSFKDEHPDAMYGELDFVYGRAITGAWKLDKVWEIHEGDAAEELAKEGNQSLYSMGENILIFSADGTADEVVKDGDDSFHNAGTWEMKETDHFTVKAGDNPEMQFYYFRVDDTLLMDVKDESPEAVHPFLRFIFARTEYEAEHAEPEVPETQAASQETTKPAQPAQQYEEETPIAGGKIFTGYKMDLYDPYTGTVIRVEELNQGGWADVDTGIIYTQEGGGGDHYYGNDGSVLVSEWYYYEYIANTEEETPIAGGQIFTGYAMTLYDPDTGEAVTVQELNQGGWANPDTGVIYTQEGGGGDHYYGNDGSVLVSEWYYNENTANAEEETPIAGGQIFTGYSMTLYDPDTGEAVTVQELNQGGWANPDTGVIYTQEGGGGDHYYGNDGSVLVSEWYYYESNDYEEDYDDYAD